MAMKKAAKKSAKKAARKTASKPVRKGTITRRPSGYATSPAGIFIPEPKNQTQESLVSADKLKNGMKTALQRVNDLVQEIVNTSTTDYEISEIELTAGFNADGKFMGFGVGGEASVLIRIKPTPQV